MDWSFNQECLGAFPMYFIGKVGVAKTRGVEVGTKSPGQWTALAPAIVLPSDSKPVRLVVDASL